MVFKPKLKIKYIVKITILNENQDDVFVWNEVLDEGGRGGGMLNDL